MSDVTNKIKQRDLLAKQAVVCDEPLREASITCGECPADVWGSGYDSDDAVYSCGAQAQYEGWMIENGKIFCPKCNEKVPDAGSR